MTHRDDNPEKPAGASAHAHGHGAVDCGKVAQMLGDYVDDQLPPDEKSAVDQHMAMCAPCIAFLKQYRFAPDAARKVLLKAVPPELESRVLSFLRDKCKK
jgi:anti-sigma factor RsiW